MKVITPGMEILNVKEVKVGTGYVLVDGEQLVHMNIPVTIMSETITGFMALSEGIKFFGHMKCWQGKGNGEQCPTCPVGHTGTCGITAIKNEAIREGLMEGTINEVENNL
jgi:hypothetical protein